MRIGLSSQRVKETALYRSPLMPFCALKHPGNINEIKLEKKLQNEK